MKYSKLFSSLFYILILPFILFLIFLIRRKKNKILWGPVPIINIKGHSIALNELGYQSVTLVSEVFNINDRSDFDLTYSDLIPIKLIRKNNRLRILIGQLLGFFYVIKNAKVYNTSYFGGYLGNSFLWRLEFFVYKLFDIKIVISAFGGDVYQYSKLIDYSLKHGLIMSYPDMAKEENIISNKVKYFTKKADLIINGNQFEGLGRYDLLPQSNLIVMNNIIRKKEKKTSGKVIKIAHCPNHRGFKGTEFVIDAVNQISKKGFKVELKIIENIPRNDLIKIFHEDIDILVEQLICPTYGMNAVEGMASGLVVLSNLSNSSYSQVFRRYSFLNECPIVSTNPENIVENLEQLILNRKLRELLGTLGIQYVKKYHSIESGKYFFKKIYNQLLNGVDEDLINMYHPLKSNYAKQNYIKTPLKDNNIIT